METPHNGSEGVSSITQVARIPLPVPHLGIGPALPIDDRVTNFYPWNEAGRIIFCYNGLTLIASGRRMNGAPLEVTAKQREIRHSLAPFSDSHLLSALYESLLLSFFDFLKKCHFIVANGAHIRSDNYSEIDSFHGEVSRLVNPRMLRILVKKKRNIHATFYGKMRAIQRSTRRPLDIHNMSHVTPRHCQSTTIKFNNVVIWF